MKGYSIYHYCAFRDAGPGEKLFVHGVVKIHLQPHEDGFFHAVCSRVGAFFTPPMEADGEFVISSLTKLSDIYYTS